MDKIDRFREITDDLAALYEVKNHDYGDSFGDTWKKLGCVSALTRLSDKLNRAINLMTKTESEVVDESIIDTFKDMANYSIMTIIELENECNT